MLIFYLNLKDAVTKKVDEFEDLSEKVKIESVHFENENLSVHFEQNKNIIEKELIQVNLDFKKY